jgi:hypothetical protein
MNPIMSFDDLVKTPLNQIQSKCCSKNSEKGGIFLGVSPFIIYLTIRNSTSAKIRGPVSVVPEWWDYFR